MARVGPTPATGSALNERGSASSWRWTSVHEQYKTIEILGQGTYGVVYKAEHKTTGEVVAMKRCRLDAFREFGIPETTLREVALLRDLRHENVMALYHVSCNTERMYLICEYLDLDLKKYIRAKPKSLTHNILVSSDLGKIKIADFGLARSALAPGKTLTHEVITLWYRAPELLLGHCNYTSGVDIWSLGCIIAELLSSKPLYVGDSEIDTLFRIFRLLGTPKKEDWPEHAVVSWEDFPKFKGQADPFGSLVPDGGLDEEGRDLLHQIFKFDSDQRLSALDGLEHPWLAEVREQAIESGEELMRAEWKEWEGASTWSPGSPPTTADLTDDETSTVPTTGSTEELQPRQQEEQKVQPLAVEVNSMSSKVVDGNCLRRPQSLTHPEPLNIQTREEEESVESANRARRGIENQVNRTQQQQSRRIEEQKESLIPSRQTRIEKRPAHEDVAQIAQRMRELEEKLKQVERQRVDDNQRFITRSSSPSKHLSLKQTIDSTANSRSANTTDADPTRTTTAASSPKNREDDALCKTRHEHGGPMTRQGVQAEVDESLIEDSDDDRVLSRDDYEDALAAPCSEEASSCEMGRHLLDLGRRRSTITAACHPLKTERPPQTAEDRPTEQRLNPMASARDERFTTNSRWGLRTTIASSLQSQTLKGRGGAAAIRTANHDAGKEERTKVLSSSSKSNGNDTQRDQISNPDTSKNMSSNIGGKTKATIEIMGRLRRSSLGTFLEQRKRRRNSHHLQEQQQSQRDGSKDEMVLNKQSNSYTAGPNLQVNLQPHNDRRKQQQPQQPVTNTTTAIGIGRVTEQQQRPLTVYDHPVQQQDDGLLDSSQKVESKKGAERAEPPATRGEVESNSSSGGYQSHDNQAALTSSSVFSHARKHPDHQMTNAINPLVRPRIPSYYGRHSLPPPPPPPNSSSSSSSSSHDAIGERQTQNSQSHPLWRTNSHSSQQPQPPHHVSSFNMLGNRFNVRHRDDDYGVSDPYSSSDQQAVYYQHQQPQQQERVSKQQQQQRHHPFNKHAPSGSRNNSGFVAPAFSRPYTTTEWKNTHTIHTNYPSVHQGRRSSQPPAYMEHHEDAKDTASQRVAQQQEQQQQSSHGSRRDLPQHASYNNQNNFISSTRRQAHHPMLNSHRSNNCGRTSRHQQTSIPSYSDPNSSSSSSSSASTSVRDPTWSFGHGSRYPPSSSSQPPPHSSSSFSLSGQNVALDVECSFNWTTATGEDSNTMRRLQHHYGPSFQPATYQGTMLSSGELDSNRWRWRRNSHGEGSDRFKDTLARLNLRLAAHASFIPASIDRSKSSVGLNRYDRQSSFSSSNYHRTHQPHRESSRGSLRDYQHPFSSSHRYGKRDSDAGAHSDASSRRTSVGHDNYDAMPPLPSAYCDPYNLRSSLRRHTIEVSSIKRKRW